MFQLKGIEKMNEEQKLKYILNKLQAQLSSEEDELANISNATAILDAILDRINWAGFYFIKNEELVLGPFQGLPACNRIQIGKGVCGTAVLEKEVQRVEDVHKFPGHIACDSASKSEIVIPIIKNDIVYGVLDIDSPEYNRFTELEEKYLVKFVELLNEYVDWKRVIK
ncbi:GAF domain-containing protein [Oceanirhabdus sp. W0125-5]|uniref:GAF domain-containing protein n=1 Tax=Oceanirhabdus sp. W0125-5 TaxID=2999116 RepID=UPI0022F2EFE6|nr:GAF domain-containing protein [Oceanirhabdus sp. W0125-5]WBW98723.1 GAF domain-containing protein [Oceanirhabdus sp. W0125-5]